MRGRKPHPTALRVLRGNPGHRPLNTDEPHHEALALDCPAELTGHAKTEWDRVVGALVHAGQVTEVDRAVLLGYCEKYGQWRALEAEAATHPSIIRSPSGYPMPNPLIGMANKVFALMLKAAAELGMTPSTRGRVQATSRRPTVDKLKARYFGQRRGA